MTITISPRHPGLYINDFFIKPSNLSFTELAKNLNVSESAVSRLLNAKSNLSYDMAIRLGKLFDHTPEYFMALQMKYGLFEASKELDLSKVITL